MLQVLSADEITTTSTSSSTEGQGETTIHSTMDAEVINTSFKLCCTSDIMALTVTCKSKQTQMVKARRKIMKTAIYTSEQQKPGKICDKHDDPITKKKFKKD